MSAEEEDGVLVRRGFHGAVRDVIDLKGNPKQEVVRESGWSASSARQPLALASGVGTPARAHDLEASAATKHPDGELGSAQRPNAAGTAGRDRQESNGRDPARTLHA